MVPPPCGDVSRDGPAELDPARDRPQVAADGAGDDDALRHAEDVALHPAPYLDPAGGEDEIPVDRALDHDVRARDDEVVVDTLGLGEGVVARVELEHGGGGARGRAQRAERGQGEHGERARGAAKPAPQPQEGVGAAGDDGENEESVDQGEEQVGPASRHDRLQQRARRLTVESDASQAIEERRDVAGPRGRDAERAEREAGDEQPGHVLLPRPDVLGQGFLVLGDGRPQELRLRAQGLVARAAAGAGDQVAARRLAAILRQLTVGEPEDGQLVEVLLRVVTHRWSLARSARRARRRSTPTRFSERPRMSPMSR